MRPLKFNLKAYMAIGVFNCVAVTGLVIGIHTVAILGLMGSSIAWVFAVSPKKRSP